MDGVTTDDPLRIATRLYEALDADDMPALIELCADDVTVEYPAASLLSYGGTWHGREGIARFLEAHDESEEILGFEVARLVADGGTVLALGTFRGRARLTGREWTTKFVHQLTIDVGRLRRWEAFFDTAIAVHAHRTAGDVETMS